MDTNMDNQHGRKTWTQAWTQAWTQTWTNMNANMDTHMDKNRDKNMETGMGKKHGDKHGQTTWTQAWTQKKELYFKVDLVFLFLTFWERNKKENKIKTEKYVGYFAVPNFPHQPLPVEPLGSAPSQMGSPQLALR